MAIKHNLNVNVGREDTVLIDSTATNSLADRIFFIGNRNEGISVEAWGRNEDEEWVKIETRTIGAQGYDTIELDVNHYLDCKLIGKTTSSSRTSSVDAFFIYTPAQ